MKTFHHLKNDSKSLHKHHWQCGIELISKSTNVAKEIPDITENYINSHVIYLSNLDTLQCLIFKYRPRCLDVLDWSDIGQKYKGILISVNSVLSFSLAQVMCN